MEKMERMECRQGKRKPAQGNTNAQAVGTVSVRQKTSGFCAWSATGNLKKQKSKFTGDTFRWRRETLAKRTPRKKGKEFVKCTPKRKEKGL